MDKDHVCYDLSLCPASPMCKLMSVAKQLTRFAKANLKKISDFHLLLYRIRYRSEET